MKTVILVILIVISGVVNSWELSGIDPAYDDYDVRFAAMGGAGAALNNTSPAALIYNPSLLAGIENNYILQFSNSTYLNLLSYNYVGISWRNQKGSVISLGLDFSGDEILTEYEMILSWSRKADIFNSKSIFFKQLDLGINFRLMGSSYGNNEDGAWYDENDMNHQVKGNSLGFAFDLGALYHLSKRHRLGLMGRNLINMIYWKSENEVNTAQGSYDEARPVSIVTAYSYTQGAAVLCLDYDQSLYNDRESYLRTGLEVKLFKNVLNLRSGIETELYVLETVHYDFGCGINLLIARKEFQLDISYRVFNNWQGYNNLLFGLKTAF